MAVHTCAVLYGTVLFGRRGLQITIVVYCFLISLFSSFTKPLLLAGFLAYVVACKFLFYWLCVQLCEEVFTTCQAILCLSLSEEMYSLELRLGYFDDLNVIFVHEGFALFQLCKDIFTV